MLFTLAIKVKEGKEEREVGKLFLSSMDLRRHEVRSRILSAIEDVIQNYEILTSIPDEHLLVKTQN